MDEILDSSVTSSADVVAADRPFHVAKDERPFDRLIRATCGETHPKEDPAERELCETVKASYAVAVLPEQHAMVKELRTVLPTGSVAERAEPIDDIDSSIGWNVAAEELEF